MKPLLFLLERTFHKQTKQPILDFYAEVSMLTLKDHTDLAEAFEREGESVDHSSY